METFDQPEGPYFDRDGFWAREELAGRAGAPDRPPTLPPDTFGLAHTPQPDRVARRKALLDGIAQLVAALGDCEVARTMPSTQGGRVAEWSTELAYAEALRVHTHALVTLLKDGGP